MKNLIYLTGAVFAFSAFSNSWAARIEVSASEIATIQPEDSTLSPRVLVKWSLPEGLSEKDIDAAFVRLTLVASGDEPLVVGMMPMKQEWTAAQAEWSSGWEKEGGGYDEVWTQTAVVTDRNGGAVTMDVRHLIRETIAGNRTDFGFIIVPDSTALGRLANFDANATAKLSGAKLTVVYRDKRDPVAKD